LFAWLAAMARRIAYGCWVSRVDVASASILIWRALVIWRCFLLLLSLAHVLHSLLLLGFALPLYRKKLLIRAIGVCSCFVGSLETVLAWLCAIAII